LRPPLPRGGASDQIFHAIWPEQMGRLDDDASEGRRSSPASYNRCKRLSSSRRCSGAIPDLSLASLFPGRREHGSPGRDFSSESVLTSQAPGGEELQVFAPHLAGRLRPIPRESAMREHLGSLLGQLARLRRQQGYRIASSCHHREAEIKARASDRPNLSRDRAGILGLDGDGPRNLRPEAPRLGKQLPRAHDDDPRLHGPAGVLASRSPIWAEQLPRAQPQCTRRAETRAAEPRSRDQEIGESFLDRDRQCSTPTTRQCPGRGREIGRVLSRAGAAGIPPRDPGSVRVEAKRSAGSFLERVRQCPSARPWQRPGRGHGIGRVLSRAAAAAIPPNGPGGDRVKAMRSCPFSSGGSSSDPAARPRQRPGRGSRDPPPFSSGIGRVPFSWRTGYAPCRNQEIGRVLPRAGSAESLPTTVGQSSGSRPGDRQSPFSKGSAEFLSHGLRSAESFLKRDRRVPFSRRIWVCPAPKCRDRQSPFSRGIGRVLSLDRLAEFRVEARRSAESFLQGIGRVPFPWPEISRVLSQAGSAEVLSRGGPVMYRAEIKRSVV